MVERVTIKVVHGDALSLSCDVLALKYAQARYGVDAAVARVLSEEGHEQSEMAPQPGGFRLLPGGQNIASKQVVFVGVEPLRDFDYREIRAFSRKVLSSLAGSSAEATHIGMTLHGPGYGLDEFEAFESLVAGIIDAIESHDTPDHLDRISIVERNLGRASRMKDLLAELLPQGIADRAPAATTASSQDPGERLRAAGYASESKAHIFVAMPFKEEMDDHYHYGIQGAVRAAGYLCERADLSTFTGDVMRWVKDRISTSSLLIADLTDANPNVYLEVGYAWGCGVPTVLLVSDTEHLKFDVQGQRCLVYKSIRDLEQALQSDLKKLGEAISTGG